MNNPLDWLALQKRISDYADMQDKLIDLLNEIVFDSDGWIDTTFHSKIIKKTHRLIDEAKQL